MQANKEAPKEPELKESEHKEAEAATKAESAKEADAVKDAQAPVDTTTSNENVKVQTLQTEKDKEVTTAPSLNPPARRFSPSHQTKIHAHT